MALFDNLLQVKLLSLPRPVDYLGLVLLQVDVTDLDQVPEVVVRPEQLCLPALQLVIYVLMCEQASDSLRRAPHHKSWSCHHSTSNAPWIYKISDLCTMQ